MTNDVLGKVKLIPVIRALSLISQGNTKVRACQLAGISVDTLDNRLAENPLVVSEFLIEQRAKINQQYEDVIEARAEMLRTFIEKARDPEIGIKTKLSIDARLAVMQESMERELGLVSLDEDNPGQSAGAIATDAETFINTRLKGPSLRRGAGKATIRETTISFSLEEGKPEENTVEGELLDNNT